MQKQRDNLEYLKDHHGELYRAYQEFGQKVHEAGGPIDAKHRWLIKIGISAACQYELALRTHIRKAQAAGCSREEIEHAILLTAPTAGFPVMMGALLIMREEMGEG
jgi:4-carboxymuconolactone decarboxylase